MTINDIIGRPDHGGSGSDLIAADRVKGTEVFNASGDKLGTIDSIFIDKVSGEVAYVVMSFGGFLGIGERFHPLPWELLDYDTELSGYRVDLDRDELEGAPHYDRTDVDRIDYGRDAGPIDDYYAPMGRGSRAADYDNSEDGYGAGDRDDSRANARPAAFYSPEQQAARSSNDDVRGDTDVDTEGAGFYSPEQQAARNASVDDNRASLDMGNENRRDPASGSPAATGRDWPDGARH